MEGPFPVEVNALLDSGRSTIDSLRRIIISAKERTCANISDDPRVLGDLQGVMEGVKTLKAHLETIKSKTVAAQARGPTVIKGSVEQQYLELLGAIHTEIKRAELVDKDLRQRLTFLESLKSVNIGNVVDTAQRISMTGRAPDGWDSNTGLPWPFRPPYPTEDLIRGSRLFQSMASGTIPEGHVDASQTSIEASHDPRQHMQFNAEEADSELLRGLDIASL